MANTRDTSSTFRIVAIVAVVLLLGAGALVFLQGAGGSSASEADWRNLESQAEQAANSSVDAELLSTAASDMSANVASLRNVANALLGEESDLDLRALDNNARELARAPLEEALDVSVPTVVRDWRFAQAWLAQALDASAADA